MGRSTFNSGRTTDVFLAFSLLSQLLTRVKLGFRPLPSEAPFGAYPESSRLMPDISSTPFNKKKPTFSDPTHTLLTSTPNKC